MGSFVGCLAVKQKRQDVANRQPLGEGQGQVLVLAESKPLPHQFVEGLIPGDGIAIGPVVLVSLAMPQ